MPATNATRSETSNAQAVLRDSNLSDSLLRVESSLSHWHPESLEDWLAKVHEIADEIKFMSFHTFTSWEEVQKLGLAIDNLRWVGRFGYDWLHKPVLQKRVAGRVNETKSNLTLADLGL